MAIRKYEDLNQMELDIIREVGSIGTGNAAGALSGLLGTRVGISIPKVYICTYDEATQTLGDPETIVAGVISRMTGEISGIMLFLFDLDYCSEILRHLLDREITDFTQLGELEMSALNEVGNIMISTYVSAMCSLADIKAELSVPNATVNMLGALISVPIVEFGYETDRLLMINGRFCIDDRQFDSSMLMLPDIKSLNYLMKKLTGQDEYR